METASGHQRWELPEELHLLNSDINMDACVQTGFVDNCIWVIESNVITIELHFSLIHK